MTLIHKSDIISLNKSYHTSHFPGGSDGKNPPAMLETWVQSLGWEDPLEEGTVTHSNILAWRIPMDRGAWWATCFPIIDTQSLFHFLNQISTVLSWPLKKQRSSQD